MSRSRLPVQSQDRDLQTLSRRIRYAGAVDQDPERPGDGSLWVRKDLSPPELRTQVNGELFSIPFVAVGGA